MRSLRLHRVLRAWTAPQGQILSRRPVSSAAPARLSDRARGVGIETALAHAGCVVDPLTGGVSPAIHLASTYERDEDLGFRRGFIYGCVWGPQS